MLNTEPLTLLTEVAKHLAMKGYTGTVEYPGFIAVPTQRGTWNIGDVNGTWGADLDDPEGTVLGIEVEGSEQWTDPVQIADALIVEMTKYDENR